MDATGGSGSNSPVWPIVDDNDAMDMNGTMDNLEDRISNLERVFAYIKNKKMLERKENKPNKETPSSDDTADENIAKFEVASKSKSSTSKPEKALQQLIHGLVLVAKPLEQENQKMQWLGKYPRMNLLPLRFVDGYPRLESRKSDMENSFTLGSVEEPGNVKILQSCNSLLLCCGSGSSNFAYVYNPRTNLFKRLPQPKNSHDDLQFLVCVILRIAFDPRKSPFYKVVQFMKSPTTDLETQVYSSEIYLILENHRSTKWCRDRSIYYNFAHFSNSIYWDDAFHWLESENMQLTFYKLNIEDHDYPIITTIEIPYGLHRGRNFLQSLGGSIGSDNPMLVQIYISGILHLQGKLFESRGCLLVCRDDIGSSEFTIYEMMKGNYKVFCEDKLKGAHIGA
ncbi:hypothetical protein Tco_0752989 [Tanacetum coccineum]